MTNKQLLDHSNGNGNGNGKHASATQIKDLNSIFQPTESVTPIIPVFKAHEQPVLLERPSWWSHAFVWGIVGITASGILWACLAPIEQAVPAMGKLEALGAAREMRAPNGGVVREIRVKDGDRVQQGQLLLTFDPTSPQADLDALRKTRDALLRENQFYSINVNGGIIPGNSELASLTRLRSDLAAEIQFLQSLINGNRVSGTGGEFNANQQRLIEANRAESQSREAAAQLQIREAQQQRASVEVQLAAALAQLPKDRERLQIAQQQFIKAQQQLITARQRFLTAQAQLPRAREREVTARNLLATDQALLERIIPVAKQGAIADLQVKRQEQQLLTRQSEFSARQSDVLTSISEISARQDEISRTESEIERSKAEISARESDILNRVADINRFRSELQRLNATINQAQQQWQNAKALSEKDVRTKIADNQKRISDIDTQLARLKLDNQKRLLEIESQLQKAQQAVQYQELRAPVDGVVFDLKPNSPGYVVRQIDNEPVMKIVPNDKLVASVYLTNKDIGHVKTGMEVDINVASFPSTEFGTIEGKLVSIGSDALAPTQERPFYAFPAKIELERSSFVVNGNQVNLQSGMEVNATIKVRKRKVIDIFTELFQKTTDSLKTVR
jgi:hemolysin D